MAEFSALAFFPSWAGPGELVLLFALVLVMFGPRKLPEIARSLGRVLSDLRRASQDFKDQVMNIEDEAKRTLDGVVKEVSDGVEEDVAESEPPDMDAEATEVAEVAEEREKGEVGDHGD